MNRKLFKLQEDITKTLANEKRLEIIHLLKSKELSVSELASMLGVRQPNISQHLAVLRKKGIVITRREGNVIHYKLSDKKIGIACDLIRGFLRELYKFDSGIMEAINMKDNELFPFITDPVCGMRISVGEIAYSYKYGDKTYHFCAIGCKNKFLRSPKKYLRVKMAERVSV